MMRLTAVVLLAASAALAACDPETDPPRDPVEGIWDVQRTVHVTGTNCPTMNAGAIRLSVEESASPALQLLDVDLYAGGDPVEVTPTHLHFETEEYLFAENQNPVLIAHDLDAVGDQLVGTASASGDGEYLGCHWTIDLVGTREPEPACKSGGGLACAR